MTDANSILDHIEGLLGNEGSRAQAEAMFHVLENRGYLTFDPQLGFQLAQVDEAEWLALLIETEDAPQRTGRWSTDTHSRYR